MKNEILPKVLYSWWGKVTTSVPLEGRDWECHTEIGNRVFFRPTDIILKRFNIFLPLSNNNILNPPRIFLFSSRYFDRNNNITKSYVSYHERTKIYNPRRNLNIPRFHTISIIPSPVKLKFSTLFPGRK